MYILRCLVLASVLAPAVTLAAPGTVPAPVPAPAQRLSDAQVATVLAEAAARREALEAANPAPRTGIHGEAGVAVGTGGYRAAYGTAFVPLGADGLAILSFSSETAQQDERRTRRR